MSGGILSGGYCPGGYCPGGYCPDTKIKMSLQVIHPLTVCDFCCNRDVLLLSFVVCVCHSWMESKSVLTVPCA